MKTGKALLGVLTGLAAGAALGVIFFPQGGKRVERKSALERDQLADVLARRIDEKFSDLEARIDARKNTEGQGQSRNR
jgi:gas vesicle protein